MVHLHTNTFHVLSTAAKDFSIHISSLKGRLGPEALVGRHHVRVAAKEERGQGGLHTWPVYTICTHTVFQIRDALPSQIINVQNEGAGGPKAI